MRNPSPHTLCRALAGVAWLTALVLLDVLYEISWGGVQFAVAGWSCIALPLAGITMWWFASSGAPLPRRTVTRFGIGWLVLVGGFVGLEIAGRLELHQMIRHETFDAVIVASRLPFVAFPLALTAWMLWRLVRLKRPPDASTAA